MLHRRTNIYKLGKDGAPGARAVARSKPVALELAAGARAHRSRGLFALEPRLSSPMTPDLYLVRNVREAAGGLFDRVQMDNEVLEQCSSDGWRSRRLAGIGAGGKSHPSHHSSFNAEGAGYSGFPTAVDLVGFNDKPEAHAASAGTTCA